MDKFEDYCKPRKNITWERHIFNCQNQKPGETIDEYVTDLRSKSKSCEFGDITESLIWDRLVCGITSDKTRSRLLKKSWTHAERHPRHLPHWRDNDLSDEANHSSSTPSNRAHWQRCGSCKTHNGEVLSKHNHYQDHPRPSSVATVEIDTISNKDARLMESLDSSWSCSSSCTCGWVACVFDWQTLAKWFWRPHLRQVTP